MIIGQSTAKSIELMKEARARFVAEEKQLAASVPTAVLKRFRLQELDRAYADDPGGSVNCTCATDPPQSQGAFMAFPNDTAKMLLCCAECGKIHHIGEEDES